MVDERRRKLLAGRGRMTGNGADPIASTFERELAAEVAKLAAQSDDEDLAPLIAEALGTHRRRMVVLMRSLFADPRTGAISDDALEAFENGYTPEQVRGLVKAYARSKAHLADARAMFERLSGARHNTTA